MLIHSDVDRYQFQPRLVKLLRWLRCMPTVPLHFSKHVLQWLRQGAPKSLYSGQRGGRWKVLKIFWQIEKSMAQHRMGHWWYVEEVITELENEK